jgi:predicted O-methyltransferase YrrM
MIVDKAIENYLQSLVASPGLPEQQAIESAPPAGAIVGPLEGQFLYLLTKIGGVRRILEIGTATGYSGLWFAQALAGNGGRLITIEREADRARRARENFQQAGYSDLVEIRVGDAFTVLETLEGLFDLIFVDILRHFNRPDEAPRLLAVCQSLLHPGGLLVADNVLVDGEVIQADPTPRVQGILAWNRQVSEDPQLETIILPLRDGLTISRKKNRNE